MPTAPTTTTTEDALLELALAIARRFRARTAGSPIDPAQASVMHALSCRGAIRLGDLADAVGLDASTVSRHVQHLAERGLVEREHDPDDGRARIIALSADGAEALAESFRARREVLAEAVEDWSLEDRERLQELVGRLTAALSD